MTAYPAWTPASRPGIVPLHPLGFGMILGRSFTALRQNPRVLLGFALVVQTVATLIASAGIVAVALTTFLRLDTLQPGTDDFETVMTGSIAITAVTALVLSLAAGALGVLVQGVVVSEVAHAVVAEKLTLRALWRRVRPVAWRLIGYTVLVTLGVLIVLALLAVGVVAVATAAGAVGIALGVLLALGAIPLSLWLTTKLLLVPAAIILERATIMGAITRSWALTRTRFWPTLGIIVIISVVFGAVGQVVGIPFSLLSVGVTTVVAPTGEPDAGAVVAIVVGAVLTQVVTLLVQSIALIVQSTATALIYIDCRMRHEGLDLDLLAYVERRDSGATDLRDPYSANIGRAIAPRPVPPAGAFSPAGPAAYPPPPSSPPGSPRPQAAAPGSGAASTPQPSGPPAPAEGAPGTAPAPSATRWVAPGHVPDLPRDVPPEHDQP